MSKAQILFLEPIIKTVIIFFWPGRHALQCPAMHLHWRWNLPMQVFRAGCETSFGSQNAVEFNCYDLQTLASWGLACFKTHMTPAPFMWSSPGQPAEWSHDSVKPSLTHKLQEPVKHQTCEGYPTPAHPSQISNRSCVTERGWEWLTPSRPIELPHWPVAIAEATGV